MNNIHQNKIKKFLNRYDINSLAVSSKFQMRNSGKILAQDFLVSFFSLMLGKCFSLRQWANVLSSIINEPLSFQAVAKRLNRRTLSFVKSLIGEAMAKNASLKSCIQRIVGLAFFNRILLEDSTCIKLPSALFDEFPGSRNQSDKHLSMARIQLCVDIKSGNYVNYHLTSYRQNDISFASNIINYLKPNDLVIRDLGYCSHVALNKIKEKGAYFVSRLNMQSTLFSIDNQVIIDLEKILKRAERRGATSFESNYIVGVKNKIECRVVCIKLSQQQIQQRLRQRKKTRSSNKQLDAKTKYLMSWNILITNIESDEFSIQKIYEMYTLRWHIELIFKMWKSYFRVDSIIQSCQGPNKIKPELLFHLCLCFIVIIVNPQFKSYQKLIYEKYKKFLSPMKFCKTLLNNLTMTMNNPTNMTLVQLTKTCCYDKRKDRVNIYEKIIYN